MNSLFYFFEIFKVQIRLETYEICGEVKFVL